MKEIATYKIVWNINANQGIILVQTPTGVEQLLIDSPKEGKTMLDLLRYQAPAYIQDNLLYNGFQSIVAAAKARAASTDKLRLIEGIGPKIEGVLKEAGIVTFQDLVTASLGRLKDILAEAGSRYKMHDPGTWSEQAALAAAGETATLAVLQKELKGGKRK